MGEVQAATAGNVLQPVRPEPEPEDEIPPEYRVPAIAATEWNAEPWRPGPVGIAVRVVAYTGAVTWPFVGALIEYTNVHDGGGFVSRALPWFVPVSAASALGVKLVDKAVRTARGHVRVYEPEDEKPPVSPIVLAGIFAGICAVAFVVGVLRGVMIHQWGR